MSSRTTLYTVVLLVLVCLACQKFQRPAFRSSGGTGGPTDALFTDAPNPVSVSVELEAKNAQTATVSKQGGQLKATDAAGNRFTLDIPAGALVMDTEITMTPVGAIGDLPVKNGLVGAVQFKPDGLFLYEDAVLTIEPAKNVPVENQILFGYLGKGQDLYLATPGKDFHQIQVRVPHFSGFGLGSGMATDRAALLLKRAADHEVRIQQQVADLLSRERQSQLLGNPPGDLSSLAEYFKSYYGLVVRPRMLAAGSSCENGKLAIQTLLGYERQMQLLGFESNNSTQELAGLMETVHAKCREEKVKECQAKVDPKILIQFELGFERQKQLLGLGESTSLGNIAEEAIKICGQSYKVSGSSNGVAFSGTICRVNQPFVLNVTFPGGSGKQTFTPSSDSGGSVAEASSGGDCVATGGGPYTITIDEAGVATLKLTVSATLTCPNISNSRTLTFSLPLQPASGGCP